MIYIVTGNIYSGKTTFCSFLSTITGFPYYHFKTLLNVFSLKHHGNEKIQSNLLKEFFHTELENLNSKYATTSDTRSRNVILEIPDYFDNQLIYDYLRHSYVNVLSVNITEDNRINRFTENVTQGNREEAINYLENKLKGIPEDEHSSKCYGLITIDNNGSYYDLYKKANEYSESIKPTKLKKSMSFDGKKYNLKESYPEDNPINTSASGVSGVWGSTLAPTPVTRSNDLGENLIDLTDVMVDTPPTHVENGGAIMRSPTPIQNPIRGASILSPYIEETIDIPTNIRQNVEQPEPDAMENSFDQATVEHMNNLIAQHHFYPELYPDLIVN